MMKIAPALALALGHTLRNGVYSQPIIYDDYYTHIFANVWMPEYFCGNPYSPNEDKVASYSSAFTSISYVDGPSTPQYLAMFSEKFVESNGKVYTVKNSNNDGGFPFDPVWPDSYDWNLNGLYEVENAYGGGSEVYFNLIYEDDNIGQIVASSEFDPIQIIGVDQVSNKIYGYYQDGFVWKRVPTVWGDAKDGSLATEPVKDGEGAKVVGLSTNNRMFGLWNKREAPFPGNFEYHKNDHIQCAGKPAVLDDWSGFWAGSRGEYCPGVGNNQLKKYTWYGDWGPGGPTTDDLIWAPASKITRLSPVSNIFGVTTNNKLLTLWDTGNGNEVHTVPFDFLSDIKEVRAVGGLDNGWARGIFVSNGEDKVYNVYYGNNGWTTDPVEIDYHEGTDVVSVFFGNWNERTYLLYGWSDPPAGGDSCGWGNYFLYELVWSDDVRYEAELRESHDDMIICGQLW